MQLLNKGFADSLSMMSAEKGKICVSIIVPTHHLPAQRSPDRLILKSAFQKAKQELAVTYKPEQIKGYLSAIDDIFEQTDLIHADEGLGFFFSPDTKLLFRFSFPVKEKVFVGERFLMRDALLQLSYSYPYYVLHLTEGIAQLYKGQIKELTTVEDENFPFVNIDDYEYNPPSRGSSHTGDASLQAFEKDPSVLEEIRCHNYLQKVDQQLKHYRKERYPLVICGELKEVAYFKKITQYAKDISGFLVGNYQHLNTEKLAELVWPVVQSAMDEKKTLLVNDFKERIGTDVTAIGIVNTWQAAEESRAYRLFIERDFSVLGYLDSNGDTLYLQPPEAPYKVLPDAVDEVIGKVLEQGGEVIFVENGTLKTYQHIALLTRY